ncbi:hypothetical protein [Microcystis phage Mel-JY01]
MVTLTAELEVPTFGQYEPFIYQIELKRFTYTVAIFDNNIPQKFKFFRENVDNLSFIFNKNFLKWIVGEIHLKRNEYPSIEYKRYKKREVYMTAFLKKTSKFIVNVNIVSIPPGIRVSDFFILRELFHHSFEPRGQSFIIVTVQDVHSHNDNYRFEHLDYTKYAFNIEELMNAIFDSD